MPYKVTRTSNGVRVKNKATGKVKHFKNRAAFKRYARVAEAVSHGWKPKNK